jgi:hypothetical protein
MTAEVSRYFQPILQTAQTCCTPFQPPFQNAQLHLHFACTLQEFSPGCSTVHHLPQSGDLTLLTSHQSIVYARSALTQRGINVYLCVVKFRTERVSFRLAPPYPSTLSFLRIFGLYLVRGLPIFGGISQQFRFYEIGLRPYAQPPATLEDRWAASSSSGCFPPTCLAHTGGSTNSYATASLS